ncbi:hypothetical protein HDU93_005174 [Gonapodya sp. JEL0774]|nr:hypothetical protein HDU93_005174 [Gonapodya sp. JEL0774]
MEDFNLAVTKHQSALRVVAKSRRRPKPVTWSSTASSLASLLTEYAAGLSEAVIEQEMLLRWDEEGAGGVQLGEKALVQTRVLSCRGLNSTSKTKILTLADVDSEDRVEMLLHHKYTALADDPLVFTRDRRMRATGLRLLSNLARLLPTELILLIVDERKDRDIISRFGPLPVGSNSSAESNLRLTVQVVGPRELIGSQRSDKTSRVAIELKDVTEAQAVLYLYDEMIHYTRLFQEGDTLLVHNAKPSPYLRLDRPSLEIGPETYFFLLPPLPADPSSSAGHLVPPRDGKQDLATYSDRIYITNLTLGMQNVSLLAKIQLLSQNFPIGARNRFIARITDGTGIIDVNVFDLPAHLNREIRPGQVWFLEGMYTAPSPSSRRSKVCLVVDHADQGRMRPVSTLPGILTSPSVRTPLLLVEALNQSVENFYCTAFITGWSGEGVQVKTKGATRGFREVRSGVEGVVQLRPSLSPFATISRAPDVTCGRTLNSQPLDSAYSYHCSHCSLDLPESSQTPSLSLFLCLDDGTACLAVQCDGTVAVGVAGVAPGEFASMSEAQQIGVLGGMVGKEVVCAVAKITQSSDSVAHSSNASPFFRLDAVTWANNPAPECIELLATLGL